MKRRRFGQLTGASLASLKLGISPARANATGLTYPATPLAKDPSLLQSSLTPLGAIRAGNADGTIPAWTGGNNTPPAGWQAGGFIPDPNAGDAVVVKINAGNMAQYSQFLTAGVMGMMTKYSDFYINVYPAHRTACAPQDVYDSIAQNVTRASLVPQGPQFGFTGAINGIPFPILDTANPLNAGAQCIWNHYVAWKGRAVKFHNEAYAISSGSIYLANAAPSCYDYPYYHKGAASADGPLISQRTFEQYTAPANSVGEEIITTDYTNPIAHPNQVWQLLNGQGRVRRAPEVSYDTPASTVDGLADTDEFFGFGGQPDRYDWTYKGMQELFIPYNNNTLFGTPAKEMIKAHFFDPQYVRWEKHRVHVVDARVRQGQRNTIARRIAYFDEDTYQIAVTDCHDANDALVHVGLIYFNTRPDLPGTFIGNNSVHNLQTGDWTPMTGPYNEKAQPTITFQDSLPASTFDPNNMAASAQY